MHNPRVSDQAKAHAEEEVRRYSSDQSDEERHTGNMKRGLKAYVYTVLGGWEIEYGANSYRAMHNPRNTGEGRSAAKQKLQQMGEDVGPTE